MAIEIVKGKWNSEKNPIGETSMKAIIRQIGRILEDIEKAEQNLKAYNGENDVMLANYYAEIRAARKELSGMHMILTCLGYDIKGLPGEEEED